VDIRVAVQGQQVATLRVGRRHHGERFRPDEQSALTDVGRRVGSLVQTAVLITDLQRSRETLVTAREEERRRLRQDLHDGVGPELAGLALQLDSLAGRLGSEAELADRARELRDRMRRTVAEVRRVVDDLRPPARARHPISDQLSRPASGGTVFHQDSESRPTKCSPAGGYPPRVCRMADSLALIRPLQGPPRSP
jgi:signal transduction histidine kinase